MVHTGLLAIPMTKNTGSVVHTDTLTLQSSPQLSGHSALQNPFEIPPKSNVPNFICYLDTIFTRMLSAQRAFFSNHAYLENLAQNHQTCKNAEFVFAEQLNQVKAVYMYLLSTCKDSLVHVLLRTHRNMSIIVQGHAENNTFLRLGLVSLP